VRYCGRDLKCDINKCSGSTMNTHFSVFIHCWSNFKDLKFTIYYLLTDTTLSRSGEHQNYFYWRKCLRLLITASHNDLYTVQEQQGDSSYAYLLKSLDSLDCWHQLMMTSHHLWLCTSPHSTEILVNLLVADTWIVTPVLLILGNCIWWVITVTITHAHATQQL
jgi:hypothetical protein